MLFVPGLFKSLTADEKEFSQYVTKFGKNYATREEYDFRFGVFSKNLKIINNHPKDSSFQLGLNHMTDWTDDEFGKITGVKSNKKKKTKFVGTG